MANNLSGAMVMPCWVRQSPKKSISVTSKEHFEGFRAKEFCQRMSKKSRVICLCKLSSPTLVKMLQLSI